jgi:hypothetical protein
MTKTASVAERLADLNLTQLLGLDDFIAELYAVSLSMILPDRQQYFAQPQPWDAHNNGQVFIPHSLSSKYYKAPLVKRFTAYQFCRCS